MDFENENIELLNNLQECQEEKSDTPTGPKPNQSGLKKGSKPDIIQEIFNLCRRANIPCEHSESQMKRMNKRSLLELLAQYCEKVVEKKVLEKCKIKENLNHLDEKQKTKLMNIGILRMAHDSLCFAAESLTHRFSPYTIEGMTRGMKENKDVSVQIDQCLAEIAEEYDVLEYVQSPTSRLMLIWITSGVSHLKRKSIENTNDNLPKVVRFGRTKITPTYRDEPVRRQTTGQKRLVKQNTQPPTR